MNDAAAWYLISLWEMAVVKDFLYLWHPLAQSHDGLGCAA